MSGYMIIGVGYLALLVTLIVVGFKRRMDSIRNEQRAAQHHRERLDKVIHDDVLPTLHGIVQAISDVDRALQKEATRRSKAKPSEPPVPVDPAQLLVMRDDLLELARELERPAGSPAGVKAAASTGGRRLLRAASRHIPAHARRRQPPG